MDVMNLTAFNSKDQARCGFEFDGLLFPNGEVIAVETEFSKQIGCNNTLIMF